jgi:hypothetical protein
MASKLAPGGAVTGSRSRGGSGTTSAKPNTALLRSTMAAAKILGTYSVVSQGSPDSSIDSE